jgi:hypothetical protein
MTVPVVLDSAGRRRSPATMPGYHAGRPLCNKGMRYPADPPTVEEIVAVMRHAADDRHGLAGPRDDRGALAAVCAFRRRSPSRSTTSTRDAVRCSSAAARAAGAERSAWTSGAGSTFAHGSPHAPRCLSGRCSASSTAPPAGDPGQAPRSARSSAGSPLRRGLGVASRRTSCATPTPSSWPARASRSTSSCANSGTQPRHDLHLPARNRPRGDHRRRPRPTRADMSASAGPQL